MNKIGEFFKPQQKDAKVQEAQEKKDLLSNSSANIFIQYKPIETPQISSHLKSKKFIEKHSKQGVLSADTSQLFLKKILDSHEKVLQDHLEDAKEIKKLREESQKKCEELFKPLQEAIIKLSRQDAIRDEDIENINKRIALITKLIDMEMEELTNKIKAIKTEKKETLCEEQLIWENTFANYKTLISQLSDQASILQQQENHQANLVDKEINQALRVRDQDFNQRLQYAKEQMHSALELQKLELLKNQQEDEAKIKRDELKLKEDQAKRRAELATQRLILEQTIENNRHAENEKLIKVEIRKTAREQDRIDRAERHKVKLEKGFLEFLSLKEPNHHKKAEEPKILELKD